jgi:hypothetical protein
MSPISQTKKSFGKGAQELWSAGVLAEQGNSEEEYEIKSAKGYEQAMLGLPFCHF